MDNASFILRICAGLVLLMIIILHRKPLFNILRKFTSFAINTILKPIAKALSVENIVTISIFLVWMLYLVPILFAPNNPINHRTDDVYFDNAYQIIHYTLLSFMGFTIPFISKIKRLWRVLSFMVASWSSISLYYELINLKYPEEVLNNPYHIQHQGKIAVFFVSLAIFTIYREKIWKLVKDE